jgi:hypothetical protein
MYEPNDPGDDGVIHYAAPSSDGALCSGESLWQWLSSDADRLSCQTCRLLLLADGNPVLAARIRAWSAPTSRT